MRGFLGLGVGEVGVAAASKLVRSRRAPLAIQDSKTCRHVHGHHSLSRTGDWTFSPYEIHETCEQCSLDSGEATDLEGSNTLD